MSEFHHLLGGGLLRTNNKWNSDHAQVLEIAKNDNTIAVDFRAPRKLKIFDEPPNVKSPYHATSVSLVVLDKSGKPIPIGAKRGHCYVEDGRAWTKYDQDQ